MTRNWTKAAAIIGVAVLVGIVPVSYGFVQLTVKRNLRAFPELRAFSEVAFGTETGRGGNEQHVVKWTDPVIFATSGTTGSIDAYVAGYFLTLSDITGLSISSGESSRTEPNFLIRSLASDDMEGVIEQGTWRPHARGFLRQFAETNMPCVFVLRTQEGRIVRADVFLKHDINRAQAGFCIQEEVAQALGLPNDSDVIANTVFSDVNDVTQLTPLDETLLRLLYLDVIEPGMSRILALYKLGAHIRNED